MTNKISVSMQVLVTPPADRAGRLAASRRRARQAAVSAAAGAAALAVALAWLGAAL